MKYLLAAFLLCCLIGNWGCAAKRWLLYTDEKMISEFAGMNLENGHDAESYFEKNGFGRKEENLGFGWKQFTTGRLGKRILLTAVFYYYNDSLAGFKITGTMPRDMQLLQRYQEWYSKSFKLQYSKSETLAVAGDVKAVRRPLKEYPYPVAVIPGALGAYMSPESDLMFGDAYMGGPVPNAVAFSKLKDSLTRDQALMVLYAVNPASRLAGIRYYYQHSEQFTNKPAIKTWIARVIQEIPRVPIVQGCSIDTVSTVNLFAWDEFYSR